MVPKWCLYDRKRSTFHNGLSYREARVIVKVLGPEDRLNWYAWKEGWPEWKLLSHVAELVLTTTDIKEVIEHPPLPVIALDPSESNSEKPLSDDFTPAKNSNGNAGGSSSSDEEDRKTERIIGELAVEIVCRGRKFFSTTRDISLKGVQLKDSIPDWMAGYCTLILSRPEVEQKLEFVCSIVENQELGKKVRLEIQPSKDSLHLKRWLLDLHLKNIKKSVS